MVFRDRIVGFQRIAGERITPHPENPRKHGRVQRAAILGLLRELGICDALLVRQLGDDRYQLLDGEMRHGIKGANVWPCLILDLSDDEARKFLAGGDLVGDLAEWDRERIAALAAQIEWQNDAAREMFRAHAADYSALPAAATEHKAATEKIDRADELAAKWQTRLGQVWELGRHRVLIGDCTSRENVRRVCAGERPATCFTSPPYHDRRAYRLESRLTLSSWDRLMRGFCEVLPLRDDGQLLVNLGLIHDDGELVEYWREWFDWMPSIGWKKFDWLVWDKLAGLAGEWYGRCAPAHEFVFHFAQTPRNAAKWVPCSSAGESTRRSTLRDKNGVAAARERDRIGAFKVPDSMLRYPMPDSVFRIRRENANGIGHPAPFPVELARFALETWPGDSFEPFLGSGSTLLAAEQLGRRCFALELSPAYAAVAIERWVESGGDVREVLCDGQRFGGGANVVERRATRAPKSARRGAHADARKRTRETDDRQGGRRGARQGGRDARRAGRSKQ